MYVFMWVCVRVYISVSPVANLVAEINAAFQSVRARVAGQ